MSDLSECCYGMGFGPEGDGVELMKWVAAQASMHMSEAVGRPPVLVHGVRCENAEPGSFENIQWPQWLFDDKPESNAKPSLPALTRQAGEKYKGLGFCDGLE